MDPLDEVQTLTDAVKEIARLRAALEEIEANCNGYGDIAGWACRRAAAALRPDTAVTVSGEPK